MDVVLAVLPGSVTSACFMPYLRERLSKLRTAKVGMAEKELLLFFFVSGISLEREKENSYPAL